jgi:hypothetical protein
MTMDWQVVQQPPAREEQGISPVVDRGFHRLAVQAADILLRVMNADQQKTSVRDRR